MRYVILRDDDTNAATPAAYLDRLYRPFLERGMPVNLSVIPEVSSGVRTPDGKLEGFLTAGKAKGGDRMPIADGWELVAYLRSEPSYHVLQHGCHHDYFEFGSIDRQDIRRRLETGARRLKEAGFPTCSTFVAPYDRLSREAFAQVTGRFGVVSTGWFELGRIPGKWWLPYLGKKVMGRSHWRAGGAALLSHPGCLLSCHRPYRGMLETIQAAVSCSSLTVLVTHWWEYFRNGSPDEDYIQVLHSVADWLHARRDIRVVPFSAVASRQVPLS